MRILTTLLLYFLISEISAYSITQIEGIDGVINRFGFGFDAEGNTFVTAAPDGNRNFKLYRLNLSNNISSVTEVPPQYFVSQLLVSPQGDAYLYLLEGNNGTLAIARANSTEVEIIDEMLYELSYMDNDGNFFYTNQKGVYVHRSGSSASVPITNLEGFKGLPLVHERILPATDKSGNTYLPVITNYLNVSLALVTTEALQEEKPYAVFLNGLESSHFIEELKFDQEDNLWMTVAKSAEKGVIKKLVDGNWKIVLDDTRSYNRIVHGKGKTYILESDTESPTSTNIYYINPDDEVVQIPELINMTDTSYFEIEGTSDSEGQVYFHATWSNLSSSLGMMVTIKNSDETKLIPITIPTKPGGSITPLEAKLDFNDDVWILYYDLYHLEKGETVPELVNNPNNICTEYEYIYTNSVTKKVYVSCSYGLFIVKND